MDGDLNLGELDLTSEDFDLDEVDGRFIRPKKNIVMSPVSRPCLSKGADPKIFF